jgi:hypothetical protein
MGHLIPAGTGQKKFKGAMVALPEEPAAVVSDPSEEAVAEVEEAPTTEVKKLRRKTKVSA